MDENRVSVAFEDYFDIAGAQSGYESHGEYLADHMALLDMCIEYAVLCREIAGQGREALPLRGMVITPDQIRSTLDAGRRSGKQRRPIPACFRKARAHIAARMARTSGRKGFASEFLFDAFELDGFSKFCYFAALAVEMDRKYETLFGFLQDGISVRRPALGTVAALYELAFGAEDNLMLPDFFLDDERNKRLYFFERPQFAREETTLSTPLRLREKICTYALGENRLTARLSDFCRLLAPQSEYQPCPSVTGADVGNLLLSLIDGDGRAVVNLYGPKGCGRELSLSRFSAGTGIGFLRIDAAGMHAAAIPPEELARLITVEYLLDGALPLFSGLGRPEDREAETRLLRLLFEHARIVLTITEEKYVLEAPGVDAAHIPFALPDSRDSLALWAYFAKKRGVEGLDFHALACKYTLSPGSIRTALNNGLLKAALEKKPLSQAHVVQAIRDSSIHNMKEQAKLINAVFTWDDLVVPKATRDGLMRLCSRVKYRDVVLDDWGFSKKLAYGRSTSALFYGPPGTGKTMAAQVVANDLELELYRADLSQIMNKYIGETEKNLSKLFDEARNANGILFFDEADALFSKRTEVTDSKDKYANAETAFLLQKIEEYEGMVILATNLMHNFDDAFKRRITYTIPFEKPSAADRKLLWQKVFPKEARLGEKLDLDFLADEFEFTGSVIKSIAVNASYEAASRGEGVNMGHIVRALKLEYEKSGEIFMRSKLGAYDIED